MVTDHLVERFGYVRAHPGRICREIAQRLFGAEDKTRLNEVNDAMRGIDPNVWVRVSLEEIPSGATIILDGLRFKSNLEYLHDRHFLLWKVEAPIELRKARLEARGQAFDWARDAAHAGEIELENHPFDAVLVNDGDLERLYTQIASHLAAVGV
jgi:hypothetical protein